jgi:hypothetical protein
MLEMIQRSVERTAPLLGQEADTRVGERHDYELGQED